ncbi:MAG: ribosomal protein S18-alanine N-acetyltransferase [Gemmatimonadaceae bacterium]
MSGRVDMDVRGAVHDGVTDLTNVTVSVRAATDADLPAVVVIERVSFGDAWTRGMFACHLRESSSDTFLVACDAAQSVVGYAIVRVIETESELFNIAVQPSSRGTGLGSVLLDAVMQRCAAAGADEMWLEVRASNHVAIALYSGRGFVMTGRRKGYYNSPREDALVLRAEMSAVLQGSELVQCAGVGLPSQTGDRILSSTSQPSRQETI